MINFGRKLLENMVLIYVSLNMVVFLFLTVANYNHVEFGFNQDQYGPGIFLTALFPLIWIILYLFSKHIAKKKLQIVKLESSVNNNKSTKRGN